MGTWTAPAFLDQMKARLDVRFAADEDFTEVSTWTAPVDVDLSQENVVFHRVIGDQEWAQIGAQRKKDIYTVEAVIVVFRMGAGEAIAKAARDRAKAILSKVEDDLIDLIGSPSAVATAIGATQIRKVSLAGVSLNQGGADGSRFAEVPFNVQLEAAI